MPDVFVYENDDQKTMESEESGQTTKSGLAKQTALVFSLEMTMCPKVYYFHGVNDHFPRWT